MKKHNIGRKLNNKIRFAAIVGLCFLMMVFIGQKIITKAQMVETKRYKPELVIQTGHYDSVWAVTFSPDGKTLASGSDDKTVKLWNVETGQQLKSLEGHTSFVNSVAFSPDGKTLASGSNDNSIKLWNVETGDPITSVSHIYGVNSVAFSPDGKILASGSNDKTIRLWNVKTGQLIKSLEGHVFSVRSVAFSPNGKTLVSASWDNTIKLWNVETGDQIRTINDYANGINSVVFSPNGKTLASGNIYEIRKGSNYGASIKLWDVETGQQLKSLEGHNSSVNSVAFSPDGKLLASASVDKTIKLWNVETGEQVKSLEGNADSVLSVAFSPNGKMLASGGKENIVKLWNVETKQQIKSLEGHTSAVNAVAISPDNRILASGGKDKTIKLWNLVTSQQIKSLEGHMYPISSIEFSPDGKTLASGSNDKTIKLWNVETGEQIKSLEVDSSVVNSIRFSPDGKMIASGNEDGIIKLWNVETSQQIKYFDGKAGSVRSITFSHDGKILASGNNYEIKLWNVKTGELIKSLNDHSGWVNSVAFSPDGKTLASASVDKTIKLWNVETGKQVKSLENHKSSVNSVAFSIDGTTLVSGSNDKTVKLWNVETGEQIKSFEGHTRFVSSVVFSHNNNFFISASIDATLKLWRTDSNKPLATLTSLDKEDWVVTASDGSFDASPSGLKLMHYTVYDSQTGYEIIALDQLKSKSFTPGLLREIFLGNFRPNEREYSVTLYPTVEVNQAKPNKSSLNLKLTNRGGGIGRVEVKLNGSEIISDARVGKNVNGRAASVDLAVEIPKEKLRGGENKVEIIVWNLENDVRSRAKEVFLNVNGQGAVSKGTGVFKLDEQKKPSEINFYAIVAGVSDYAGDSLDLRYAAKDSEDIANAVSRAARRYFCSDEMAKQKPCERVHLRLLSTEKDQKSQFAGLADVPDFKRLEPKKQNFKDVFAEVAAKAKPEDVVFVYLSGHGTAIKSVEAKQESSFYDMYLYPTMDATTLDGNALGNQSQREPITITSLEFAKWVFDIKAAKKVMIFDTCAAGAAQKDLMAMVRSDTDEDKLQIRSLDRLRERTGFYVLMGSASDKVSYEANEFRQGLLTYSLIEAMTVDTVLDDSRFLDIEKWFGYTENKVEDLAKGIGGVQKPYFFKGESKSFSIGRIEGDERKNIQPAPKVPLILQPALRVKDQETDDEELTDKLELRLMEQSLVSSRGEGGALNYIKATKAANGLSPRGFYTVNADGTITAEVSLVQDKKVLGKVKVTGKKEEIIGILITEIIKAAQQKQ